MSFPARFPGTCVECGERFHVDDPIRRADDGGGWVFEYWVHDTCGGTDHPDPDPCCPTCWLTICDCEKDTRC